MKTTIGEVLSYFDNQVPNQYSDEEKIRWLNEIEAQIYNDIIKTHKDADKIAFNGYTADTDINTQMIVPLEYSELYRFWLEKSVHYANGEIDRMNNAMTMFQNYYDNFYAAYNRAHRPIGVHGYRL